MDWLQLVNLGIGGLLGALGQILVARYSKSRHERDAAVAKEYLTLASITADELEKRINLIGKLDNDVRGLSSENYLLNKKLSEMEDKRAERDDHFESMEARVSALQAQVDADSRERADLRSKLAQMDSRYRALWKYMIALLEQLKQKRIRPVEPPDALKSDPDIIRFLNDNEL